MYTKPDSDRRRPCSRRFAKGQRYDPEDNSPGIPRSSPAAPGFLRASVTCLAGPGREQTLRLSILTRGGVQL